MLSAFDQRRRIFLVTELKSKILKLMIDKYLKKIFENNDQKIFEK